MQTVEQQLTAVKLLLAEAQTEYHHCFARADWTNCSKAKRKVGKHMQQVKFLVAQKLAMVA